MAQTTIVPFAQLPACATTCGALFDANGGCVPPAQPTADVGTYQACFCGHAKVSALAGGAVDVCQQGCQADGLSSLHNWFTSFCNNKANTPQTTATTGTAASTGTSSPSTGGSNSSQQGGGDWLSNHWKWVIMIVVIFVAIVVIWVGAFIWRRRYLRKKDRMYELGKGLPSTVAVNAQGQLVGAGVNRGSAQPMLPPGGAINAEFLEKPKKERKRWNVGERT